ncbi:hypothetical protein VNI00_011643 [Paramarasmius palmivorus]|uniref:Eisosome component PIL1-domain-containing protein n=1 Tax=Paramarasmius palmivorus TaxID=297713 RepID=A0AAW0CDG1_9AGAR
MFKSAATKLAHNSTIPSLAGNSDLRPLQDLINAEKLVLNSLQRLSADFTKAAEALRTWGMGEGDDLGDILSASTNLLNYFSNALAQYATHEHSIREHMKAIRTREESLDELKRRRKALLSKADTAEKKLSKMSPEHKNLAQQMDTLNRLREEIRMMDSEIMTEEAALGDFKRSKTRALMGLKFGGLLECCEKGTVAGEFGKLVVMELPDVVTQPGMARPMYTGQQNVYNLLQEAQHCIGEIAFSTVPSAEPRLPRPPVHDERPSEDHYNLTDRSDGAFGGTESYLSAPRNMGTGHFIDPSDMSNMTTTTSMSGAPSSNSPTTLQFSPPSQVSQPPQPPYPQIEQASRSTDDFGASPPQVDSRGLPGGGRFATFPVKTNTQGGASVGYQLRDDPPMLHQSNNEDDSFSSSIAAALNERNGRSSYDEPAPSYQTHQSHSSIGQDPQRSRSPPSMPPAEMESPWENVRSPLAPSSSGLGPGNGHQRAQEDDSDNEGGLAYDKSDTEHPSHDSKHVRFGEVSDVDTELKKRHEAERQELKPEPINTDVIEANLPRVSPRRVPPPTFSPEEEEKQLNAAAAREISRELDALNFSAQGVRGMSMDDVPASPSRGRNDSFGGPVSPIKREPSPLVPPSAPFANRGPSPRPESVSASPVAVGQSPLSRDSPAAPPYVPDSNYTASPPISPVRETTSSPISQKASSPVLPPPSINMPERSSSSFSSIRGGASPYQTPPEFPRSPLGTRSTSSLVDRSPGASPAPPPAGTRTISAAAFRRPAKTGSDAGSIGGGIGGGSFGQGPVDTSPLHLKKRLPASPYPPQRPGSAGNAISADVGRERSDSQTSPRQSPSNTNPPRPPPSYSDHPEDQYDYLSAYTSEPTPGVGSPMRSDFGSLGQVRVANPETENNYNSSAHYSLPPGAAPATPGGYGDGRFATNLESELR